MTRPIVMDFQPDPRVFDISGQLLFGPSILACPVPKSGATRTKVYLPIASRSYDFWERGFTLGGRTVGVPVGIETMPRSVKAGSINPYGPSEE